MPSFPDHTLDTAPAAARAILMAVHQAYGMTPNLHKKLSTSSALLEGYWELSRIFANTSLTAVEQQVVLLAVSARNGCTYCVGAHSAIADMRGVPVEVTDALRDERPVPDQRLEALRRFTGQVVGKRGWVSKDDLDRFLEAGYGEAQILEVILGVGLKTLSNYANHIMQTELDPAFAGRAWAPAAHG